MDSCGGCSDPTWGVECDADGWQHTTLTLIRDAVTVQPQASDALTISAGEEDLFKRLGIGFRSTAIVALVLASGTAVAQGPSANGTPPPPQVGFERSQRLTPQEELRQGDAIVSRIEHSAAIIRKLLDAARQARQVIKSICLSDKLSQVDVAGRSTKDRQTSLQAAVQRGDTELANHEFTIMTVLRQRVEQLSAEANQCLGEEVAFIGQTQVITEINPNLPGNPDEDTEWAPEAPVFVPLAPPPQPATNSPAM